eukprot:TRINITY_DN10927_c0_g1_i1.p1 TRINITY_DN10927_c0_g1~~TRINITY_DN10927_c0_g1_i1.p1  ORF type:complete len:243 (-),score=8.99 TRINITY_DN10927_c0_g1_i1:185-913(-)
MDLGPSNEKEGTHRHVLVALRHGRIAHQYRALNGSVPLEHVARIFDLQPNTVSLSGVTYTLRDQALQLELEAADGLVVEVHGEPMLGTESVPVAVLCKGKIKTVRFKVFAITRLRDIAAGLKDENGAGILFTHPLSSDLQAAKPNLSNGCDMDEFATKWLAENKGTSNLVFVRQSPSVNEPLAPRTPSPRNWWPRFRRSRSEPCSSEQDSPLLTDQGAELQRSGQCACEIVDHRLLYDWLIG